MLTYWKGYLSPKDTTLIIRWTIFLTLVHLFFIWFVWWYFVGGYEGVPMPEGMSPTIISLGKISRWWDVLLVPISSLITSLMLFTSNLFLGDYVSDFKIVSDYLYDHKVPKYEFLFHLYFGLTACVFAVLLLAFCIGIVTGIGSVFQIFVITALTSPTILLLTRVIRYGFCRTTWWRWSTIKNYMLAKDKS